MPLTCNNDESQWLIELEKVVDITCAAQLKTELIEALSSGKGILLDVSHVTDLDVTAFQLLQAAARAAGKASQSFTVCGQLPQSVDSSFRRAGFDGLLIPAAAEIECTSPADPSREVTNGR